MPKYIKKIAISTIESFLDKKIKQNKISIGADTATYHTAFAILRTTDTYLIVEELDKIEVPKLAKTSTIKSLLNNVDLFCEQLDSLKNKLAQQYKFDYTQIEDCFYSMSVKTTKMLAYNSILTYDRIKRISDNTTLIMPNTARSLIGFKKTKKASGQQLKKEIVEYINNALELELKISENDKSDALVLALAGLIGE